jgi:hypothetical protein
MTKDLYLIFSQIFLGIITTLKFGYEQESLQKKKTLVSISAGFFQFGDGPRVVSIPRQKILT